MQTIKVSIIIPVYNVEPYIERCLKSVANQTVAEGIECIVVDDCGKDDSITLAERFVAEYEGDVQFKLLYHEHNKGLSGARNTGIREARGEYFYLLDSDDEIKPDCIEGYLRIINEYPCIDLIQGLFEQGSPYMRRFLTLPIPLYTEDRKQIKRMLLDYDALPVTAANKMFRTDMFRTNNLYFKEGIIHEDNYLSFFLAKHVNSFALYKNQCYIYYINEGSIMTAPNRGKEQIAFRTMFYDFCGNIDPFMRGEQKLAILKILLTIVNNGYYSNDKERDRIISTFNEKNRFFEQIIVKWIFRTNGFVQSKAISLLTKLYRFNWKNL